MVGHSISETVKRLLAHVESTPIDVINPEALTKAKA
jgi:hypothetical protein